MSISLRNLKVKTRLWLSFGLLAVFIVIMGTMTIVTFEEVATVSTKLYKHPLTVGRAIREVRAEFYKGRTLMLTLALSPDTPTLEATVAGLEASRQKMDENIAVIKERFLGSMQEVENLASGLIQLKKLRDETITLISSGNKEQAIEQITKGANAKKIEEIEKSVEYIVNFGNDIAAKFSHIVQTTVRNTHWWVSSIIIASIILTVWIMASTTSTITRSLGRALMIANAVRDGDLSNRVEITSRDEIGQLLLALDAMQTQLKERSENDQRIAEEIKIVTSTASQGDFNKRINLENKVGAFKTIGESINRVLELNQLAIQDLTRVFSAVARGDLTQTITNDYLGELAQLKRDANITVQRLTEVTEEIDLVTNTASQGDFSKRVNLKDKTGTFKAISESINRVLEFNQLAIKDLTRVFSAVSQGDLTQTITNEYSGELAQLKRDANTTVFRLTGVTEEIGLVTGSASQGDFSKRVTLEGKTGTFRVISESINRVLEFNQLAIKDLTRVFSAVSQGDLTQTIANEYSGELAQLKRDANTTVQRLTGVTEEISIVTHAASEGDFSKRINLENKMGTFRTIGESINQVLNFNQLAIKDLMHVFSAVAQGDLTKLITNEYAGELAQLKQDANATVLKLTEIIKIIRASAEVVSSTTEEISQGNSSLSQRTTQQAASLEETASSMEQMTATVQQNADNAKQANQLAMGARERAEHGNEVVNCTILAIKEISKSSKKINEIITVIDEIAFQTNLLALNAAVEAARAGEYGRGFAVVASEVRSLAQRSASAAKEIKTLIQDSNLKVDEGSRLANQSGQTLEDIVASVKKVSDIVAEIAAASTEQSGGIEQVNKAISQMDEVVEQNSALVEELASASESMRDQAQELKKQVSFFKVGSHEKETAPSSRKKVKPVQLPAKVSTTIIADTEDRDWQDF